MWNYFGLGMELVRIWFGPTFSLIRCVKLLRISATSMSVGAFALDCVNLLAERQKSPEWGFYFVAVRAIAKRSSLSFFNLLSVSAWQASMPASILDVCSITSGEMLLQSSANSFLYCSNLTNSMTEPCKYGRSCPEQNRMLAAARMCLMSVAVAVIS